MKPETIQEKLTTEIIDEFRLPRTVCHGFIHIRMAWAYAAGFNEGKDYANKQNRKSILQLTTQGHVIRQWPALRVAARALNISRQNIAACARGHRPTAGGFRWRYVD